MAYKQEASSSWLLNWLLLACRRRQRKPYTALGTVVGAQSSKLSTLPVNKLIVLYVVFKLDESYTPSKVSILAGDGFHNLKEIKTVELVKPTG
ncbi:hypothetical protein JHK86_016316 [Glycine max]|nr:hypothetical protein JHK86_016316 [Glycine max]